MMQAEYRVTYEAPAGVPRVTEALPTYEEAVQFCRSFTSGRRQIVEMIPGVLATFYDGQTEPGVT